MEEKTGIIDNLHPTLKLSNNSPLIYYGRMCTLGGCALVVVFVGGVVFVFVFVVGVVFVVG